jgi:hypothetical protein
MRHALQMRRGHAIHRKMQAGLRSGLEATAEIYLARFSGAQDAAQQ